MWWCPICEYDNDDFGECAICGATLIRTASTYGAASRGGHDARSAAAPSSFREAR